MLEEVVVLGEHHIYSSQQNVKLVSMKTLGLIVVHHFQTAPANFWLNMVSITAHSVLYNSDWLYKYAS